MILEYIGAGVALLFFGVLTYGTFLLELDKHKDWKERNERDK